MEWIWIAAVVVILLIIIIRNIRVVQQSQAYVVERLGAFSAWACILRCLSWSGWPNGSA